MQLLGRRLHTQPTYSSNMRHLKKEVLALHVSKGCVGKQDMYIHVMFTDVRHALSEQNGRCEDRRASILLQCLCQVRSMQNVDAAVIDAGTHRAPT
eukprot:6210666-Pleurochrysis_carterae.AAC.3